MPAPYTTIVAGLLLCDRGAARGSLVPFRSLWPALARLGISRAAGESAILAACRAGSLCLHRADRCDQAPDDLPAGLVIGGDWYIGCHIRQS